MTSPNTSAPTTLAVRIARCAFRIAACAWIGTTTAATDPAAFSGNAPTRAYESPKDFGNALARAVNDRDRALVMKFFDVHAFALRVARAASAVEQTQERIAASLERSSVLSSQPLDLLLYAHRESMHLVASFKRVRQHGANVQIILRDELRVGNDIDGMGINYMEFELVRDGAGKLRAVDWYDFGAMGWVSSSIGVMLYLRGDPSNDPALRERVLRFQTASVKGDMHAAITALAELPPRLGESLPILNMRIQIALAGKEPEEARHAMTLIAAKYSQEPAAAYLLAGYYRDTQQYDQALKSLAVVEQSLGEDGTTSLSRAVLYHYRGDELLAAKAMERATQLEPDFVLAYRGLAAEYVALKDYSRASATLETLRTKFRVNLTVKQLEDEQSKENPSTAILRNRWSTKN